MARCAIGRLAVVLAFRGRQCQQPFSSSTGSVTSLTTPGNGTERKRIVFLGTPQVSALVLQGLLQAAAAPGSDFEVAAVVSRPSSRQWRERQRQAASATTAAAAMVHPAGGGMGTGASSKPWPVGHLTQHQQPQQQQQQQQQLPNWAHHSASPVEKLAGSSGIPPERILCPVSAKEPEFLDAVRQLRPDLAITAAYGGMLPQAFLDIPTYGTLNIHPSLLPKFRGAAPVTRALQEGCSVSGVSLVFTVLKCDAGPVLEQQQVRIDPDIQAPELTEEMFRLGAQMLLRQLPGLLSGAVTARDAVLQDDAAASYASKVGKHEMLLDLRRGAVQCHNHVRAMAGWPGSRASLLVENKTTGLLEPIEVKVLRTRVVLAAAARSPPAPGPDATGNTISTSPLQAASTTTGSACVVSSPDPSGQLPPGARAQVLYTSTGELLVPCGDGNMLSILEVARRRASNTGGSSYCTLRNYLTAQEFMNGLGRRRLLVPA